MKKKLDALVSSINSIYEDFETLKKGRGRDIREKHAAIRAAHTLASELLRTIPAENVELRKVLERMADNFGRFSVRDIAIMENDDFDHWLATFDVYREDLKKYSDGLEEVPPKDERKL